MALPKAWQPQLAALVKEPPPGEGWVHELKHDGYRVAAFKDREAVRLVSRSGKDWTAAFPEVAEAVRALPARTALIDGEVVVLLPDGRSSFQALQNALSAAPPRPDLAYFAFDLLHLDGDDLARRPLVERKARLEALLPAGGVLRYSAHVDAPGGEVLREACRLRAEGIVSKRASAPYRGGRGRDWLKIKCVLRQEFVIGGFTEPAGKRPGLGALLVGVREGGVLRFAGKVGTGFTDAGARELRRRLDALRQDACPFAERPSGWLGRNARWVRPELVAEVAFAEWTAGGSVRHPSFQGLREDKAPAEVVRESADRIVFPDVGLTKSEV